MSPLNEQGLYPVAGGEPPKGFKQGSYEIRLRFERDQSYSQEGTDWKWKAGRSFYSFLQAGWELMEAEALEMEKRE